MKKNKKDLVRYNPKPRQITCSNCQYFRSDFVENKWKYVEEKNISCDLHNFAVKKTANCPDHVFR